MTINLTRLNLTQILLLTVLIWVGTGKKSVAQQSEIDSSVLLINGPHVEWVKSWPADDNKRNSKSFKDRLNSIFFGIRVPVLNNPVSVLAISPDDFWVLDQGNHTLFQVVNGVGDIPHSVFKSDFDLSSLVGICAGPNSSILFTDSKSQKIFKMVPGKKKLLILNDSLTLEQPTGIAYSAQSNEIWVLETKAHCISVLDENGELKRKIGSRGTAPGEFNYPTHIWIGENGYVYVTDAMNFRIQVLNSDGKVVSVFGEAGDATGYLARPKGVATDSFGNIYIVDALFHAVQVYDVNGVFLYTFGNQGHENGEFWLPSGISIDSWNNIYVADTYNSRVQVFQLIQTESK